MKSLYFTLTLLLTGLTSVLAQTEKGRWMVGASVGNFSYSNQNGYKSFSGSISPSAGYFVANNLVVGTGIPLSLSTNNYPNGGTHSRNSSIGVSPYVSYYFGTSKLKPYVGLAYTYSGTNQRSISGGQTNTADGYTSSISPTVGVAYFINRTVALSAGLNYVMDRYKSAYAAYDAAGNLIDVPAVSTSKYLSLGISFQIFLGK